MTLGGRLCMPDAARVVLSYVRAGARPHRDRHDALTLSPDGVTVLQTR